MEKRELAIIGGGPAGLAAGLYAARAGLDVVLIEKGTPGGMMTITERIENYPGFPEGIGGMELATRMAEQAGRFGLGFRRARVEDLAVKNGSFCLRTGKGDVMARAVILATGARPRRLGVPGEAELVGQGVSYCATCDGPLFEGCEVAVVGGGDAALEEALFLTRFARRVHLIHRRKGFRAAEVLQQRIRESPKVALHLDCVVQGIEGAGGVEAVLIRNVSTSVSFRLPVEGVFIFIGTIPNSELVREWGQVDQEGYIITDEQMATSVPGLFAAGDVRRKELRQVVTAVADGAVAAMSAKKYLENGCLARGSPFPNSQP